MAASWKLEISSRVDGAYGKAARTQTTAGKDIYALFFACWCVLLIRMCLLNINNCFLRSNTKLFGRSLCNAPTQDIKII